MRRVAAVVSSVAVAAALAACGGAGSGPARSSGSLAISSDSKYLYAADTDNGLLLVIDSSSLEKVREVKVGSQPARVVVAKDDTIFVANRGSRSVSVVRRDEATVSAEIATGVDPVGMQVTSDGKTLYVLSAAGIDDSENGVLQSIDVASLKENWNIPVRDEPRGLALVNGDKRAVISLYKAGEVLTIDLEKHSIPQNNINFHGPMNHQAGLTSTSAVTGQSTFHARGMTDLAATPDGTRVFAPTQLSREAPILINPTPATPYYQAQGPRLAGSVSTSAVITFDTEPGADVTPLVDDVTDTSGGFRCGFCGGSQQPDDPGFPQTSLAVSGFSGSGAIDSTTVLQGTTAAVVDVTGDWLFMVSRDSRRLSIISTTKRVARPATENQTQFGFSGFSELPSVYSTADIGHGADGIAILGDNKTAYVYNQFDHTMQRLELNGSNHLVVKQTTGKLAPEVLSENDVVGRKAFFDANDREISGLTASVACSSCHLEGRDDGHTWQFPDGPRSTPTLAGRGMRDTAPYHWSGEFDTLGQFLEHTIISRMGGKGLSVQKQTAMNGFVDNLPAPENPYKKAEITDAQARGALVFQRAECGTCHSGEWYTNKGAANVGTLVTSGANPDVLPPGKTGLDVPSLRGIARSAPYLHTGEARTLKDRLLKNDNNAHGKTAGLTTAEIDDLVAFLRTL